MSDRRCLQRSKPITDEVQEFTCLLDSGHDGMHKARGVSWADSLNAGHLGCPGYLGVSLLGEEFCTEPHGHAGPHRAEWGHPDGGERMAVTWGTSPAPAPAPGDGDALATGDPVTVAARFMGESKEPGTVWVEFAAIPGVLERPVAVAVNRTDLRAALYGGGAAVETDLRKRIERLTYASDDGTEYRHNGHSPDEGEDSCPACWVADIRAALSTAPAPDAGEVEDLTEEPPFGSVVLDSDGDAWQRRGDGWHLAMESDPYTWEKLRRGDTLRLIHRPAASPGDAQ